VGGFVRYEFPAGRAWFKGLNPSGR
jgi:hypothetical protein